VRECAHEAERRTLIDGRCVKEVWALIVGFNRAEADIIDSAYCSEHTMAEAIFILRLGPARFRVSNFQLGQGPDSIVRGVKWRLCSACGTSAESHFDIMISNPRLVTSLADIPRNSMPSGDERPVEYRTTHCQ
jgi:hypothetical protein